MPLLPGLSKRALLASSLGLPAAAVGGAASAQAAAGGLSIFQDVAHLSAAAVPASDPVVFVAGYRQPGDAGACLRRRATGAGPGRVRSGDGAYWEISAPVLQAEMFGAAGDGVTDDGPAFGQMAAWINARGDVVRLAGRTYLCSVSMTLNAGGFEGVSAGFRGPVSAIKFTHLGEQPGIVTDEKTSKAPVRLENLVLDTAAWTGPAACTGHLMDCSAPIQARNLWVMRARRCGAFFHDKAEGRAPYESTLADSRFHSCGEHGVLIGSGASLITLYNCGAKWNGAPAWNVDPTEPGPYSGVRIDNAGAGNPGGAFSGFTVESVNVLGGDYSYNAAYGIDIEQLYGGVIAPGYAEVNLGRTPERLHEIRLGPGFAAVFQAQFLRRRAASVFLDGVKVSPRDGRFPIVTVNGQAMRIPGGPAVEEQGEGPPAEGVHAKGDRVWNVDPQSGGFAGWVCVAGGSPGKWRGYGRID